MADRINKIIEIGVNAETQKILDLEKAMNDLEQSEINLRRSQEALENSTNKTADEIKQLELNASNAAIAFKSAQLKVDNLTSANNKLETSNKVLGRSVLDNGGAMGLLSAATGGLAMDIKDAFEASELFKFSLKGWKAALAATGIGLLIVALGTIVAYWDDIKGAVDGVSSSQKKLLADQKASVAQSQKELDILNSQDNILKLQGKSEKEILRLKISQTDETIKQMELQLVQEQQQLDAQIKASERNKQILSEMLNWINVPLRLLLTTVDQVGKALGQNFGLVESLDKSTKSIRDKAAGLIFDPEEVKKEGQTAIDDTKKTLTNLKNQRAGYVLSLRDIAKKESDDAKDARKKAAEVLQKSIDDRIKLEDEQWLKLQELTKNKYDFERIQLQQKLDKDLEMAKNNYELQKALKEKFIKDSKDIDKREEEESQKNQDAKIAKEDEQWLRLQELTLEKADYEILLLQQKYEKEYEAAEGNAELQKALKEKLEADIANINTIASEAKEQQLQQDMENLSMILSVGGKKFKDIQKALAIGQVVRDTIRNVNAATGNEIAVPAFIGTIPNPVKPQSLISTALGIGGAIAKGAASIAAITAESKSLGSSKGGGQGAGGGAPQAQFNIVGSSSTSQLAESVARSQQQPIQTYVVSTEVTSQQALDRNRVTNATFLSLIPLILLAL